MMAIFRSALSMPLREPEGEEGITALPAPSLLLLFALACGPTHQLETGVPGTCLASAQPLGKVSGAAAGPPGAQGTTKEEK